MRDCTRGSGCGTRLTFHASSKSTGRMTYRFFRTAMHISWALCALKKRREASLPCRPAAWQIEAISAELRRSGRETSANQLIPNWPRVSSLTVLEVDIWTKVHGTSNCLENQSPLSPGRSREFNLSVQSSWSQKGRIKRILSIGSHDDLHVSLCTSRLGETQLTLTEVCWSKPSI